MRFSKPGSLLVLLALLVACQPTGGPAGPGASTPSGGVSAPAPGFEPFRPVEAPALTVAELALTTVPKAGGATMADLDRDEDPSDDFEPTLDVIVKEGDFGAGLTAPNGTLKVRGHSTRYAAQKSFTVELKKESPALGGYKTLFLNKHPYDLTRLRNKLAFDLFKGLPELLTLNTRFVHLTIDGQDYGLFTQVERPGDRMLEARGLDPDGNLYKAEQFEFHPDPALKDVGAPGYEKKAFEKILEIREGKSHQKLLAMIADVNNEELPINQVIAKHFDRENYLTWLAVNVVTGNLDTNSQNFLLYSPQSSSAWTFIPWDYDGAWGFYDQPNEAAASRLSRWQTGLSNWWGVKLHRRFLQDPENTRQLVARCEQLAGEFFTRDRLQPLLDSYKPVVRPFISKAPDLAGLPASTDKLAAWEAEVDRLLTVPATQIARLRETLERPMPVFLGEPAVEAGGRVFNWDASFDLQGDALTYDFKLSKSPDLASPLVEKAGLTEPRHTVSEPLAPGTYYWQVIVRDAKAPASHWQLPFDTFEAGGLRHHGVREFKVQ